MIAMSRRLVPEGSSPNTMRGEDGVQIQQQRVTICFSGIKTTNRNGNTYCPSSYKEMVESLGCQYSTVMDVKSVGYLVVGKVGMDKHVAALKYKIPCVTVCLCGSLLFTIEDDVIGCSGLFRCRKSG